MINIRYFADHMAKNKLTEFEGEYIPPAMQEVDDVKIPDSFGKILEQNYQALLIEKKNLADAEIAKNKEIGYEPEPDNYWKTQRHEKEQQNYKFWLGISAANRTIAIIRKANGDTRNPDDGYKFIKSYEQEIALHNGYIFDIPEYTISHAIRLADCIGKNHIYWSFLIPFISEEFYKSQELMQLDKVLKQQGCVDSSMAIIKPYLFCAYENRTKPLFVSAKQIVPFFMDNLDYFSEALEIVPSRFEEKYKYFMPVRAIHYLHQFDGIPVQFMPKLLEFALGTNKSYRIQTQNLLARIPNIYKEAIEKLSDGKQDIRVVAIDWLAELALTNNEPNAYTSEIISALHNCVKLEKKEAPLASLLTALEMLGEDISQFMNDDVLLKDAEKGLKAKRAKHFDWFDPATIPILKWKNNAVIEPKIIEYWIILSEKLKEPKPNGLLQRYLKLLDENSQNKLSEFVLETFILQDTQTYTMNMAKELADKYAPSIYNEYQHYNGWLSPYNNFGLKDTWSHKYDFSDVTEAVIKEEIIQSLLKTSYKTAIKSKGMLALAHKAKGVVAVKALQNYIKNHHRRTAQIGALLDAFSASDDPLVIQWTLNISRRYRTKSIQEKAMDIIAEIAKRNHWTPAQLGDRTIPMAGVDDDGILQLDYGTRTLTAYIDEKYKFVLQNEQGKVIKSLPAPRQEDDKKLIKETKSLLSACKKELKQMIELQTARLYEAMCCERLWAVAEWQEYLIAHPIMKRLIARLIWLEVDADGTILQVFRPSEDGSLLNISDDEISLNPDSQIKLAHYVLLAATSHDVKQWKQHLKDYEIKLLFDQLKNTVPKTNDDENSFTDFVDTPSEAFKLRSVVTKLGYLRCGIGDGGGFDKYYKYYESLDISAVLVFSGSGVPEENIDIQLGEFRFQKGRVHTWDRDGIDFAEVPPILLAESYAEYGLIAKKV